MPVREVTRAVYSLVRRGGIDVVFPKGPQVGVWAQRRSAAQRQTESRVAGICRVNHQQVMSFRPHIAEAQYRVRSKLAFNRKKIIFSVRIRVCRRSAVIPACGIKGEKSMFGFG